MYSLNAAVRALTFALCFLCRSSSQSAIKQNSSYRERCDRVNGRCYHITRHFRQSDICVLQRQTAYLTHQPFVQCNTRDIGVPSYYPLPQLQWRRAIHVRGGAFHSFRQTWTLGCILYHSNPSTWRVMEIWNHTMSQTETLADCCSKVQAATMPEGHGADKCRMCIYKRRGADNQTCMQTTRSVQSNRSETSTTECTYSSSWT